MKSSTKFFAQFTLVFKQTIFKDLEDYLIDFKAGNLFIPPVATISIILLSKLESGEDE